MKLLVKGTIMLNSLNKNDWVAIWKETKDAKKLVKVARIEYRFIFEDNADGEYNVLAIRFNDKVSHSVSKDGKIHYDYSLVKCETGKIMGTRNSDLTITPIPMLNMVFEDVTFADRVARQELIYALNDVEWATLQLDDIKTIYNKVREVIAWK